MADHCSLCGTKLSFFGGHCLVCANQEETFCSSCHDKLYQMDNLERGRYVLENGKPDNPEKMQEFIVFHAERTLRKEKLEPPTRPCPNCGGEMTCKITNFRIGMDGGGGLTSSLWYDQYAVDLYACPECGKIEMYTANFAAVKQALERKAQKQAEEQAAAEADLQKLEMSIEREYTSYRPGRKNEKPPWER